MNSSKYLKQLWVWGIKKVDTEETGKWHVIWEHPPSGLVFASARLCGVRPSELFVEGVRQTETIKSIQMDLRAYIHQQFYGDDREFYVSSVEDLPKVLDLFGDHTGAHIVITPEYFKELINPSTERDISEI